MKQLKNGKSAGTDSIPAEALKIYIYRNSIQHLRKGTCSKVQKESYLIKLPKKGDLSSWSNYWELPLLSTPGKVFSQVLQNRMKDTANPSFRTRRPAFTGTVPAQTRLQHSASAYNSHANGIPLSASTLLIMRRHLTVWTNREPLETAETLWHTREDHKDHSKLYSGMTCIVVCGCKPTDAFQVKTRVGQGCLLSPFLLLLVIDWVLKTSTTQRGNGI